MINIIGTMLLWLMAIALILCFPLTEFARGMASNSDEHTLSKGGCILTIAGLALLAGLIWEIIK